MSEASEMAKRRANSSYSYSCLDGVHRFDFGEHGLVVCDTKKASGANRLRAEQHGFKARLTDAMALDADPTTGRVAVADKVAELRRMAEHIESGSGEWAIPRANASESGSAARASLVTRALVRLGSYQGVDTSTNELAAAFVTRLATDPKFEALGFGGQVGKARAYLETKSAAIRAAVDEIRAEDAKANPAGADDVLARLLG